MIPPSPFAKNQIKIATNDYLNQSQSSPHQLLTTQPRVVQNYLRPEALPLLLPVGLVQRVSSHQSSSEPARTSETTSGAPRRTAHVLTQPPGRFNETLSLLNARGAFLTADCW